MARFPLIASAKHYKWHKGWANITEPVFSDHSQITNLRSTVYHTETGCVVCYAVDLFGAFPHSFSCVAITATLTVVSL